MKVDEEELKSSLNEEFNIMDERSRESRTFSADSFQEPIANLHPRRARTLDESATMGECVEIMREIRHGAIMITRVGRITGIVTERDLMMEIMGNEDTWHKRSVTEIMTPNPDTLLMEDPMIFIMNRFYIFYIDRCIRQGKRNRFGIRLINNGKNIFSSLFNCTLLLQLFN